MQEFPQSLSLTTLVYMLIASILGWLGHWLKDRKRQPHEIAKINAETRQIAINTDVSLIQAATTAITKAERLQQERDHWELKCFDLQGKLTEANRDNGQLSIEVSSMDRQMRKQMAFIEMKNLKDEYLKLDQPKQE